MHDDQALNLKSVWQLAKSVARNVIKINLHEVPPLGEEQMAALREVIRATAAVS